MRNLLAWILVISFGGAFLATTKADILSHDKLAGTYSIGYWTSPLGEGVFRFAFVRMAEQLCPKGFIIISKSNIIDGLGNNRAVWVIACSEDGDEI